ncbi:MAG: PD-(D/E)XK nuclease family protein [Alphaproteobacteria bacterium]|nr:PD-(D/E)XK nuclease family protein [Alphaproteobacteria bacterium]MBR1757067.1 PD-(D/E)XK nuclease family protein [Alphaproteobacteria bacterium]
MNIFEALSQGKGSINEENTSSFLAYLMKNNESHGLRTEFLRRFLDLAKIDLNKIFGYGTDIRDCNITIELEKSLCAAKKKNSNNRIIDILLQIQTEDGNTLSIGVENKINDNASQATQLKEEYTYLKEISGGNFSIIFLAPNGPAANKEYQTACKNLRASDKDKVCFVLWDDIINTIEDMLKQEQNIQIAPMSDYLKHTLRAFCYYIKHRNDIKIKNCIKVHYDAYNEDFELLQLSNGAMRINCSNRENLMPKLMIFDVLFQLEPDKKKLLGKNNPATNIFQGTPATLGNTMFKLIKDKKQTIIIKDKKPQFSREKQRAGSNIF